MRTVSRGMTHSLTHTHDDYRMPPAGSAHWGIINKLGLIAWCFWQYHACTMLTKPHACTMKAFNYAISMKYMWISTKLHYIMGLRQHSPYVGMTRFQNGSSNQCISVYTVILSSGNKCWVMSRFAINCLRMSQGHHGTWLRGWDSRWQTWTWVANASI